MSTWEKYDLELRKWFTYEVVPKIPQRERGKWSAECGLDKLDKSEKQNYKNFNGLQINGTVIWKIEHLFKICKKLSKNSPEEITLSYILNKIERRLISLEK